MADETNSSDSFLDFLQRAGLERKTLVAALEASLDAGLVKANRAADAISKAQAELKESLEGARKIAWLLSEIGSPSSIAERVIAETEALIEKNSVPMTVSEAIQQILIASSKPLSQLEIARGLAGLRQRGMLKKSTSPGTLRAFLSRGVAQGTWARTEVGEYVVAPDSKDVPMP